MCSENYKQLKNRIINLTITNCPICSRIHKDHRRKDLDECYRKYLESMRVKLQ